MDITIANPPSNTRLLHETGFVESFVTGFAGSAGTGFGVAAIDISRTLTGAVFRIAHFATQTRTAATVVTGVCAMLTAGFV